jgi:hypothetical protein
MSRGAPLCLFTRCVQTDRACQRSEPWTSGLACGETDGATGNPGGGGTKADRSVHGLAVLGLATYDPAQGHPRNGTRQC